MWEECIGILLVVNVIKYLKNTVSTALLSLKGCFKSGGLYPEYTLKLPLSVDPKVIQYRQTSDHPTQHISSVDRAEAYSLEVVR